MSWNRQISRVVWMCVVGLCAGTLVFSACGDPEDTGNNDNQANAQNANDNQQNSDDNQQNSNDNQQNSNDNQQNANDNQQNANDNQQNSNDNQQNSNDEDPEEGESVDILWMIDNSGSMCRSQQVLRAGINQFVADLEDVDFHIGVTTTHMIGCEDQPGCIYDEDEETVFCDPENLGEEEDVTGEPECNIRDFEPVAKPMQLQSTPQPVPGFSGTCHFDLYDADHPDVTTDNSTPDIGDPNPESIEPILLNIETAVECTEDPDDYDDLLNVDEDRLRCALTPSLTCNLDDPRIDEDSDFCVCPSGSQHPFDNCIDCGQYSPEPEIEEFFPDPDDYRNIDRVLRSEEYQNADGELDVAQLQADFACISLVGTRGDGIERGLDAVVGAVAPEMTGGSDWDDWDEAVAARDEYPNAGFVRSDADTSVIFVSDENDCSHDGGLQESTFCGVHNCTINEFQDDGGHLVSAEDLAEDFRENLGATRGEQTAADPATVIPASFHGHYQKPHPEEVPDQCPDGDRWEVDPSCVTEFGVAWSGHRYEYFLREFPTHYPEPVDDTSPLPGEICADFTPLLGELGSFIYDAGTEDGG